MEEQGEGYEKGGEMPPGEDSGGQARGQQEGEEGRRRKGSGKEQCYNYMRFQFTELCISIFT